MADPPPLLRNNLVEELAPGTYRVHIPATGLQHTDHRLVTAIALTGRS
ncbi:hypothetical protein ACFQZ2_00025 [Streptomonospora algeriensis]